jgi:hypothetical protein
VEFLRQVLLFLHLLGMAALLAGFLTQMSVTARRIVTAMLHGAITQVVTGLALVGVREALDDPADNTKMAVKLVVTVVVLALILLNRAKARIPDGLFFGIFALSVLNVAVAVFWQ